MIERRLLRQLEKVASRWRHRWLISAWAGNWFLAACIALALIAAHRFAAIYVPFAVWVLAAGAALVWLLICVTAFQKGRDPRTIARRIETRYPELATSLLAAIDQRAQLPNGRFGFLQNSVIENALRHAYGHSWMRVIPVRQLAAAHLLNLIFFAAMVASLVVLGGLPRLEQLTEERSESARTTVLHGDFDIEVTPGDTEAERGTSLLVEARFGSSLPPEARLLVQRGDGTTEPFAMSKSLDDPLFGARIPDINDALTYRVEFAGRESDSFHVSVFEFPRLVRADAKLRFPTYTSLEDRVVQDVRKISAVQGTHLTLTCRLNKPVESAALVDRDGNRTELVQSEEEPRVYLVEFELLESLRLELRLTDLEGRANKSPPEFVFSMLANKPPDLKLVQPSRDMEVSPLEEVDMKANVWDDFGLARVGLSYMISAETKEVVLAESVAGKERTSAAYQLALEELEAEPDQLVSYYFWAEDTAPDGSRRRVASDMYFAEVRHFDEIFREGQAPPGGAGQQQQQGQGGQGPSQQLADLQKQIINATWKVIRREIAGKPSDKFGEDVGLLLDSQTSAMEQAEELNEEIQGSAAMQHMLDVRRHMLDAVKHLSEAQVNSQIEALTPALASEQAAYQSLLHLRAIEHRVTRGSRNRSQGGGGGGGNRSQQQLNQLQLRDNENNYETERQAQSEQEQRDGETRQVLNRLRELARRQGDLNKRVRELQSALEEAQSEQEREDIRRQLRRLREEQEKILRDVDEVRDRMERSENQERMAPQQQQLERTRENVRQASEALEQGQTGRAVTAGTRAEREMEELRDEFRRRSSQRFEEEMREMRRQAQELDDAQQEIAETLDESNEPDDASRSLRDGEKRAELSTELANQREQLDELLRDMREMIEESESSEPLLADELYKTAREATLGMVPEALEATARSIDRGLMNDARQLQRLSRQGIEGVREGVERAAEYVLGDEIEALRRARDELQKLRNELGDEMARQGGQPAANSERSAERSDEDASQQASADGERQPDSQSDAEQRSQAAAGQPGQEQNEQRGSGSPQDGESEGQNQGGSRGGSQQSDSSREPRTAGPRRLTGGRRDGGRRTLSGGGGGRAGGEAFDRDRTAIAERRDFAPLTGDDYLDWSDRLRDVEEMIGDPELRAEAARIRDRARGIRTDLKRHSVPPNQELVELKIAKPLAELQQRVVEELLRRSSPDSLVPIDRDPVPPRFSEQVRRYYEQIGNGQ